MDQGEKKRTAVKTKLNREEAAAKRKEIKAAKKAEAAEKAKKRNETPTGESSQPGSSTPQRTGKQTRIRRGASTYSSCFILSCQVVTNGKMPEMMQKCMKAVLNVGNDIEEVCFEHLSDSITAPILFSEGGIPQRNTKLRAYIRVVSGEGNVNKPNKRVGFVIRLAHEMPAQEFARTISSDMECEFGVRIFAKKLNLPHTTFKFWLKGILIKLPEAAVKAQIVADLAECGFNGDKVRLAEKLNLQAKKVWVSEKTREHEKKTYPEEALEWIKNHAN